MKEGTYLNFDGHWSKNGNEIVAEYLVDKIVGSLK